MSEDQEKAEIITKEDSTAVDNDGSVGKRLYDILSYVVAGIAAYFVGDTSIRRNIYKNFAKHKVFEDLQQQQRSSIHQAIEAAKHDPGISVANETRIIQENYRQAVKGRFESMGMKSIRDYWSGLHKNQKIESIAFAVTVGGAVLSTMMGAIEHLARFRQKKADKGALANKDDKSI